MTLEKEEIYTERVEKSTYQMVMWVYLNKGSKMHSAEW